MAPTHIRAILATALATIVLSACRNAATGGVPRAFEPASKAHSDSAAIAKARADSARYPYTAADVRFMSVMIGHHAQAIAMARLAPTHGASASIRRLAERIINAQEDETAAMRQWLRDRQQPVPQVLALNGHAMNGAEHVMPMPGMLTGAQWIQLDQATGATFDRLLLTFMIQHHRGALAMVKTLFSADGAAQDATVFKFASDVNVDQITEIARMERMLVGLVAESAP